MPSQGGMCPQGQLQSRILWTDILLPPKDLSSGQPWRQKKGPNDFSGPKPKILENSLSLHPEICPLSPNGIMIWSRKGQAKPVCASGTLGWVLSPNKAPLTMTHHWRGSHLSLKELFSSWFAHKI